MGDKKITDDTIANEEHTESKSVSPTETRSGKTDQHFLTSSNGNCDSQKHGKPVDEGNAQKKKKGTASLVKEDVLNPALEPVIAK
nr:hypothetical protein BaRGS_001338 [Batillaria attramentaria]